VSLSPNTPTPPKHPKADLPFLQHTLWAHKIKLSTPSAFMHMDTHYAIFTSHYNNLSHELLCSVHKEYLPFLLYLGISLEEILLICFTSSGRANVVFKTNTPLSKLTDLTYNKDGQSGIRVI